jgi:hypothetical protein
MERYEKETVICINEQNLEDGYFCFYTTNPHVARQIARRFAMSVREGYPKMTKNSDGQITGWDFRIDQKALPKSPFLSKRRPAGAGNPGAFKSVHRSVRPEGG